MVKNKQIARKVGVGFLVLIVVAVLAYLVYRPIAIKHDKQRFLTAQADLEKLFVDIETRVGKPDQVKRENSCSRAHLKSERGPLGCDVTIYTLYENKDAAMSSSLLKTIASLAGNSALRNGRSGVPISTFLPYTQMRGLQSFDQTYRSLAGLSCDISYSYPVYPTYKTTDPFTTNFTENLQLQVSCGGPAKGEYFPLKD